MNTADFTCVGSNVLHNKVLLNWSLPLHCANINRLVLFSTQLSLCRVQRNHIYRYIGRVHHSTSCKNLHSQQNLTDCQLLTDSKYETLKIIWVGLWPHSHQRSNQNKHASSFKPT